MTVYLDHDTESSIQLSQTDSFKGVSRIKEEAQKDKVSISTVLKENKIALTRWAISKERNIT